VTVKWVENLLGVLFLAALLCTLSLMRICGRTAPDRGKFCTIDQTIRFLHESGESLARVTALQLAAIGVVVLYVASVVWLWKRKPRGNDDRSG
jgi:hypothetical protein